jgi:hypothetical protein
MNQPYPASASGKLGIGLPALIRRWRRKMHSPAPIESKLRPPAKLTRTKTSAKSAGFWAPGRLGSMTSQKLLAEGEKLETNLLRRLREVFSPSNLSEVNLLHDPPTTVGAPQQDKLGTRLKGLPKTLHAEGPGRGLRTPRISATGRGTWDAMGAHRPFHATPNNKLMGLPQRERQEPSGEARRAAWLLAISSSSGADLGQFAGSTLLLGAQKGLRRSTAANVKQFTAPMGGLR